MSFQKFRVVIIITTFVDRPGSQGSGVGVGAAFLGPKSWMFGLKSTVLLTLLFLKQRTD